MRRSILDIGLPFGPMLKPMRLRMSAFYECRQFESTLTHVYIACHLRVLGWCSMQSAFEAEDDETSMKYFAEAAERYIAAAELFMKDDENYAYFLKIVLEAHWWQNSPLRVTPHLVNQNREALPDINKIWEHSMFSKRLSKTLQQAFDFEKEYQKRVLEGAMTLDSSARPVDMVSDHGF